MLSFFQNEWDALALQTYTLQQNLHQARQELSTALYENDAAVRVIAQVTKERDEARAALAKINVGRGGAAGANGDAMQVDAAPLPAAILEKIDGVQQRYENPCDLVSSKLTWIHSLSKTRRKRPVPEEWATADSISSYDVKASSKPLFPGGAALAVHAAGDLVLASGSDGSVGIFSLSDNSIVQPLSAGSGSVTSGLWAQDKAAIATSSGSVRVFESGQEIASFSVHAGSATAVALHPSGTILASASEDKSYVLYDLESSQVLTQVQSDSGMLPLRRRATNASLIISRPHMCSIPP